jgi:transposase InsO family protein
MRCSLAPPIAVAAAIGDPPLAATASARATHAAAMHHPRTRVRRTYDHRIRQLVVLRGGVGLARQFDVPDSTARSWHRRDLPDVVSLGELHSDHLALIADNARLKRKLALLVGVVGLLLALIRTLGLRLDDERLPEGRGKRILLHAIERARRNMPLAHALRVLRLTPARFHAWRGRDVRCALDDAPSCPRARPTRLSAPERFAIKTLAVSTAFAHMPMRTLALFAQRHGIVHATAATWYRLVHERGWQRPRTRVHPKPPKEGIRADRPGEFLHIDVTVIRLLDGSRAFVQAIIDNYSRMILAHAVTTTYDGSLTASLLRQAFVVLRGRAGAILFCDDGRENRGDVVDRALDDTGILQLVAQGHVTFSNSMIEAFWRSMKHGFLFLQRLDSVTALERFVDFYVHEHNTVMPHSAFRGQTPEEIFRGIGDHVPAELAVKRSEARVKRIADNRRTHCVTCPANTAPTGHVP